jgi:hypothetical protein
MKKKYFYAIFPLVLVVGATAGASFWYQKSVVSVSPKQEEQAVPLVISPENTNTLPASQDDTTPTQPVATSAPVVTKPKQTKTPESSTPTVSPPTPPSPPTPTTPVVVAPPSQSTNTNTDTTQQTPTPPSRRSHAS